MRALLDTNIIIHREARKVINQDIGILFRWLDRAKYQKCIHSISINEITKNSNKETVRTFEAKIASYEVINIPSPTDDRITELSNELDKNDNDKNDSLLLNEVIVERVDILITEDKKIHEKAERLGIEDKVFNIDTFLERVFSQYPELIDYKVLNVRKEYFGKLDLNDNFFDSLKQDYLGFEKWFIKKSDELAYVSFNNRNNKLLSFLFLKIEGNDEDYSMIDPVLPPKKRLKVGTFKIISNGFRLGERFLKIIFDNALINNVDEIYVTIFDKREEQRRLIQLLEIWGFNFWGVKGGERVYVRDFSHHIRENLKESYPFINKDNSLFLVPIYPDYHTSLLPDSILNNESPAEYIEDFPHRNGIRKVYVSGALEPHPKKGDKLIFYRTGGKHRSVVTTIGIVEKVEKDIADQDHFLRECRNGSVFPERELISMWNYNKKRRPFVVHFLYVYSFPQRLNMARLIDLGILEGVHDAPRGFKPISKEQFELLLKETKSDESFIVD